MVRPHKSFLVHLSAYFRKALGGPWKEREDTIISMIDVNHASSTFYRLGVYAETSCNTVTTPGMKPIRLH
jgi:hypothetical protein